MCFNLTKKKDGIGSNLDTISKRDMLQPLTLWLQYTWIVVIRIGGHNHHFKWNVTLPWKGVTIGFT